MPASDPSDPEDPFDFRDALIHRKRRELEPMLAAADRGHPPFDADAAWSRVSRRLSSQRAPSRWRRVAPAVLGLAAVLALAVVGLERTMPASMAVVHDTAAGELDSARLRDGSVVIMDGRTHVETRPGFGDATREIALRGRAHFRVSHDATRPFRVYAGEIVAEARGTAFTVADDPLRRRVDVVVTEGRVAIAPWTSATGAVVLQAGDRAVWEDGRVVLEHGAVHPGTSAWMSGERRLSGTPLSEVLPQMSRWFGLTILARDDAMLTRRISADWRHASGESALSELTAIIDARVESRGDTVVLFARRPGGSDAR
jgi:transmembrane sensor